MVEDDTSASGDGQVGDDDLAQDPTPTANQILAAGFLFEGGLGVLAIVLGWAFAQPVVESLSIGASSVVWSVIATLPLVVLLLAIDRYPVGPFRGLKQLVDETVVPLFANCRWWHLAVVAAFAGMGEELLFRGLVQQSLVGYVGVWPAVMIAALLFGLAHPLSKTYVATAAAIGIYLGGLLVVTNNLLVPIIVHALYDFVALVYLTRPHVGHAPRAKPS